MQRIARAHGWQRTGRRIRDHIADHLHDVEYTEESSGSFVWRRDKVVMRLRYRPPDHE